MMIFDGTFDARFPFFVLSESVCGRVRQSRTRRRKSQMRRYGGARLYPE